MTLRGLKRIITITEESVSVYGEVEDDDGISEVMVNGKKVVLMARILKR